MDRNTLIPLGLVIGGLGIAFIFGQSTASQTAEIEHLSQRTESLERSVDDARGEIRDFRAEFILAVQQAADDRWRRTWMKVWRDDLQGRNPEIDVPEIRDF